MLGFVWFLKITKERDTMLRKMMLSCLVYHRKYEKKILKTYSFSNHLIFIWKKKNKWIELKETCKNKLWTSNLFFFFIFSFFLFFLTIFFSSHFHSNISRTKHRLTFLVCTSCWNALFAFCFSTLWVFLISIQ